MHPQNRLITNRKRYRDDQSSSGQDEDDEDNLSVEIPPHKHSNNNNTDEIAEDWLCEKDESIKTGTFRGELKRPDLKGKSIYGTIMT